MIRKYGFFILLIVLITASLIISNAYLSTEAITADSFYDDVENAVTDEGGNVWPLFKTDNGYSVIQYSKDGKIDRVLNLHSSDKDISIISNNMYVDSNKNLYITKCYVDNTTGLVQSETVVRFDRESDMPEEVFRVNYETSDNVWLPAISHIACEGNNLFVVMNEISDIKVYCVSITSKEAAKTDEYVPEGDVYIDSAVRLDNGVIVFSTKKGIVYSIKNKEQAIKIYPTQGNTAQLSKLSAVRGNEVRFIDNLTGEYVSMKYMDFPQVTLLKNNDPLVPGNDSILVKDAEDIYTSFNGKIVAPLKYKGDLVIIYGDVNNPAGIYISKTVRPLKIINTFIKVLMVIAAFCLTVVLWQVFLYFDIKYFRKKRIIVRAVKKSDLKR